MLFSECMIFFYGIMLVLLSYISMVLVIDIIHPCNITCYNLFDLKLCYEGFLMLSYPYIWWQ